MASNAKEARAAASLGKQDHLRWRVALEISGREPGDVLNNAIFKFIAEVERADPQAFWERLEKLQKEGGRLGYTVDYLARQEKAEQAKAIEKAKAIVRERSVQKQLSQVETADDLQGEMDISELPENYRENPPILPDSN